MTTGGLADNIQEIYRHAVRRVQPVTVIPEHLALDSSGSRVRIGTEWFAIPDAGIYAIAVGKASIPMMAAVEDALGDSLVHAIAVTKSAPDAQLSRTSVHLGSHPVPDENSMAAGEAVLEFARSVPNGAIVLCLISGGGSALVEVPRSGTSMETIGTVTGQLLRAGASIQELNAVRSRLSAIKAGSLLAALGHTSVHNLIISDVLGDDPATIASGLTTPPRESISASDVLQTYGVDVDLPEAESADLQKPKTTIIANLSRAIDAASEQAASLGYAPFVVSRSLEGEAREVAAVLASMAADTARGRTGWNGDVALIAGGETTVTVRGNGVGGRNLESALAAALWLEGLSSVAIGFLGTDGDDGTSDVAGGIVTGDTIRSENRREATSVLDDNDSYRFLASVGAAWGEGPTGTNVNDLVIILVRSP